MTVNEERVKEKLKEALCNLYNTEISFANEVAIKGLIGLTLDKQSILMLEISETFGNNVPEHLRKDGRILVSHKPLMQKRPAINNLNENCKRQKIAVPGNEPPSILSALTQVDTYHDNRSIQGGIAHKHQVNSGFTTIPTLAESPPQENLNNQENEDGLENQVEVKDEPVSDDDGDVRMADEEVVDEGREENVGPTPGVVPSSGPITSPAFNGESNINQLTGMNMFAKMYDANNPLYSPFQGVHHRYQMDNESPSFLKKLYNCDQCSYSTTWPSNLKRHKQKHLEPDSRPAVIHQCDKCDYKTGWLSNLKRHMRTMHGENQERVYECPSCKTVQVSKEDVVVCKSCKRTFNSSQVMKQHVQNIMHQEMNAADPDQVIKSVQQITKTESKRLGNGEKLCMPPSTEFCIGAQTSDTLTPTERRNSFTDSCSIKKEDKTSYSQCQDSAFFGSEVFTNMHANSPRARIIQESPVIDRCRDLREPMHCRLDSISDVNGNGDSQVSEHVDTSVIEVASYSRSPRNLKRSQSPYNVDSSTR